MKDCLKLRINVGKQKPYIVYVRGKNQLGSYICEIINTKETCFSSDTNLVDVDYKLYEKLLLEWELQNAKDSIIRIEESLAKL